MSDFDGEGVPIAVLGARFGLVQKSHPMSLTS